MSDSDREIRDIKARLEKLEARMSFLFRSLGLLSEEAPTPALLQGHRAGQARRHAGAIKAFREETGASLKDAKTYVESLDV